MWFSERKVRTAVSSSMQNVTMTTPTVNHRRSADWPARCLYRPLRRSPGPVRVAAVIEGAPSSGGRPAACAATCRATPALVREAPLLAGAS
jgi:hypothetical protein